MKEKKKCWACDVDIKKNDRICIMCGAVVIEGITGIPL